jgi:hypothetical protein
LYTRSVVFDPAIFALLRAPDNLTKRGSGRLEP